MAIQIYTITNYSTVSTATIISFSIATTLTEQQHYLDLTGWNPPFDTYTSFTGASTVLTSTKTYVSDERDIQRTTTATTSISSSTLWVTSNTGIGNGWAISGTGIGTGRTVQSTPGSTRVIMNNPPANPIGIGVDITFIPPEYLLFVNNTSGLSVGWTADGNGYDGTQNIEILDIRSGGELKMSDQPSGSSTPGGSITFTSPGDVMLEIPPGSSSTFAMNYTRVTSSYGTYTSLVSIDADLDGPVTKVINNFMLVSAALVTDPASPFFDASGGGGADASSTCNDSNSVSCSAGGGGGSCFVASTLIKLYNGSEKRISDIKIGDLVLDALTGKPNKVIGVKSRTYPAGSILFSPVKGLDAFITEEHPFYDSQDQLSAISDLCYIRSPWLGKPNIVDVPERAILSYPVPVYNLMFETGETHFANGVKVNNIIKTGTIYVLHYKGFLDYDNYLGFARNEEFDAMPSEHRLILYKIMYVLTNYVLLNDNILSRTIGRLMAAAIRNRSTVKPLLDKWFQSKLRKLVFGKKA